MSVSWKCWFWGEGKTGVSGEKPLGARKRTNGKLNPRVALTPWFQPGPILVPRARRFLVGYKLSRVALGTRMNPGHTAGRQVLSPLRDPCSPQSYISIKQKLFRILEYDVSYVEGDALIDKWRNNLNLVCSVLLDIFFFILFFGIMLKFMRWLIKQKANLSSVCGFPLRISAFCFVFVFYCTLFCLFVCSIFIFFSFLIFKTRTTTWNLPGPSGTRDCIDIVYLSHPSPLLCGG